MAIKARIFNPAADLRGPLNVSAVYDGGTVTDPTTKAPVTGRRASSWSAPPTSWKTTP